MAKTPSKEQGPSATHGKIPNAGALGEKLRQSREEKGLTLEQVFDKIKLRPPIVEAIEAERWEDLPAPPFVKGFLRAYAKLLELEEQEVLALYEARGPKDTRPFEPVLTKKGPRKIGWIVATLMILAAIGATYWWIQQPPPGVSVRKASRAARNEQSRRGIDKQLEKKRPQVEKQAPRNDVATPPKERTEQSSANTAQTNSITQPQAQASIQESERIEKPPPPQPTPAFVLTGFVKERTWMRISTDGGQPKEYIFDPGSRPVWNAQRVFDIMIGNAAGIELQLNGKPLGPLGKRGKVVHLVLPKQS